MDDYGGGFEVGGEATGAVETPEPGKRREPDEPERKLVARICARIRADAEHHKKAFERMRWSMKVARRGADDKWPECNYTANITGRHIRNLVAALYAKNPKAIARRRERLDFAIWDENEQTLLMAIQTMQMHQQAMDVIGVPPDAAAMMMPPEVAQAQALVQDFQQGMQVRKTVERIGKTLQILFEYFTKEQQPVDFKTGMKQLVRRTATTAVGCIEVGFQRQYEGADPGAVEQRIADARRQIDHIRVLMEKTQQGDDYTQKEADLRELELSVKSLQAQEYVLLREGLVFDFLESTAVIPDKRCRCYTGFVGSRWLTIQRLYTPDEVRGMFGYDLGREFTPYSQSGKRNDDGEQIPMQFDEHPPEADDMVCVWKHFDKQAGVVYYVADGHKCFLRRPGPPDVYVESFWPVYALTFNEVEDPDDPVPPSDVEAIYDMQMDYNRARQGAREHRKAARPRFGTPKGSLSDEDKDNFAAATPFSVTEFNPMGDNPDINKLIQPIQVPGVDPNLYETEPLFTDVQLVVGTPRTGFGMSGKETATGEALAEASNSNTTDSVVDDLDNFLTTVARACGQILMREMSEEQVLKIAGPGAVWPPLTLEELASEVYLEVEAGSSGKPNAAQEIANWERMLPYLIQVGSIRPVWLARETLRRLDDRMDLTDAIAENVPAIVAMNRMSQPSPADPGASPDQQGEEGGQNKAPAAPGGPSGTEAPMGNNRA